MTTFESEPLSAGETPRLGQAVIEGRVTRRLRPVPAEIELRRRGPVRDELQRQTRTIPEEIEELDFGQLVGQARAAADGTFRISHLPAGEYRLLVRAVDGAATEVSVTVPTEDAVVSVAVVLPSGAHALRGRAEFSDGRAFVGRILAWRDDRLLGVTDTRGDFVILGLEAGHVRLTFRGVGAFASRGPSVLVPTDREHLVIVDPGATLLTGRVTASESDAPVVDAEIVAEWWVGSGRCRMRATTDSDGRFRVCVPRRGRSLRITAPGRWPCRLGSLDDQDMVEVALEAATRISGLVVHHETEQPIPGAPVIVRLPDGWDCTRTDEGGRFVFSDVTGLAVSVHVRGGGWVSCGLADSQTWGYDPLRVLIEPGSSPRLVLRVEPAVRCEGRIVDRAGSTVVGAVVTAFSTKFRVFGPTGMLRRVTDEQGRFAFDGLVPHLPWSLRVRDVWGDRRAMRVIPPSSPGTTVPIRIELRTLRPATFRVVDEESGQPIPGARVSGTFKRNRTRHVPGLRDLEADESGLIRIGALPTHDVLLRVHHPEYLSTADIPVALDEPAPIRRDVALRRGVTFRGRILGPDGEPLESAYVSIGPRGTGLALGGEFCLVGLPAGPWEMSVRVRGEDVGRWTVAADSDARDFRVERVPERDESPRFDFRLLDGEGKPVPTGRIALWALDSAGRMKTSIHLEVRDGRCVIGLGLDDGETEMWALAHGAATATGYPLPLGSRLEGPLAIERRRIEIRMPPEKAIHGIVRDPHGRGVSSIVVRATHVIPAERADLRVLSTALTDRDGRFRLGGLGEGEYDLRATPPPTLGVIGERRVRAGARDVEIVLGRKVSASIRVSDGDGKPVDGASVRASLPTPRGPAEFGILGGVTGEDGRVVIEGLVERAAYVLTVEPGWEDEKLAPTRQDIWVPRATDILLPAGGVVAGRISEFERELAEGRGAAFVLWYRVEGWEWQEWSAETDGAFRIPSLPLGSVDLLVLLYGKHPKEHPSAVSTNVSVGTLDLVLRTPPR